MFENLKPLIDQSNAPDRSKLFEAIHPHETRIQQETGSKLYPVVCAADLARNPYANVRLKEVYEAVSSDLGLRSDEGELCAPRTPTLTFSLLLCFRQLGGRLASLRGFGAGVEEAA